MKSTQVKAKSPKPLSEYSSREEWAKDNPNLALINPTFDPVAHVQSRLDARKKAEELKQRKDKIMAEVSSKLGISEDDLKVLLS